MSAGALHDTTDWPFASVPATVVGAFGTVRGVTELEATLAALSPILLVAVTVNV